jgi:predicted kinase
MKLQILVGPISSGKTTYCRNAADKGFICVNDDAIVNMLHGNNYHLYRTDLKALYKSIENNIVLTALAMNLPVIIDRALNVGIESRKRWIALAKAIDIPCEAVVFERADPKIHAQRRFSSDSRGHSYDYWLKVAEHHDSMYVVPTIEEGLDIVSRISFDQIQNGEIIS